MHLFGVDNATDMPWCSRNHCDCASITEVTGPMLINVNSPVTTNWNVLFLVATSDSEHFERFTYRVDLGTGLVIHNLMFHS